MIKNDRTIFILPGRQDSWPSHWQSLWEQKYWAYRVQQRDRMHPSPSAWVENLSLAIDSCDKKIVLVAHSVACHLVSQRFLKNKDNQKIKAALLVAPPNLDQKDTPSELLSFTPMIREELPVKSILVASENDIYASIERSERLAHAWWSEFVSVGNQGHINTDAGFGDWPQGEELLHSLLI